MPATGPTSPEGKRIASMNAVKHGLTAMSMVIPGLEDEDDWQTFYEGVIAYYNPIGAVEYALVDRAAGLLWRLRRVPRAERDATLNPSDEMSESIAAIERVTAEVRAMVLPPEDEYDEEGRLIFSGSPGSEGSGVESKSTALREASGTPAITPRPLPAAAPLLTYSRYETRLNGQLRQIFREIEHCKARRERDTRIPFSAI